MKILASSWRAKHVLLNGCHAVQAASSSATAILGSWMA